MCDLLTNVNVINFIILMYIALSLSLSCLEMAASASISSASAVQDLESGPHRPIASFSYPKRPYGKKKVVYCSFQRYIMSNLFTSYFLFSASCACD